MSEADTILKGAAVYTVDPAQPWAEALAIRDGRIAAIGSEEDLRALAGPRTAILDVSGCVVLPGFQDSHAHPPAGGLERIQCDLNDLEDRDGCLRAIRAYADSHPDVDWIRGGGWYMAHFPGGTPLREDLDQVVPDRPAFLTNRDGHGAWANSRALELAGISQETPDPPFGRIERDADGNPSGTLHEGAMRVVERVMPPLSREDLARGLLIAQEYLHSLGITAWQDAIVGDTQWGDTFDIYVEAANRGDLTARVVGALWWNRYRGEEQIEELIDLRSRGAAGRFAATSVKIMQDGVLENGTASLTQAYLDPCGLAGCGHDKDNRGISFVDPEELKGFVTRLDVEGFQVHFHAIGDKAVRDALNAIEVARRANGSNDNRHHIAHVQVVHPDDLGRFAELGVTANCQPLWAELDEQMVDLTLPVLGEQRSAWQYPFGTLQRSGARLAFGSDWSVSSPDPLQEMDVAMNRADPQGSGTTDPWLPEERLSLADCIEAFTMGSAYVNHLDHETGSLTVGKYADIAVVDRNLFDPDLTHSSEARVVLTMVEGEVVYSADEVSGS